MSLMYLHLKKDNQESAQLSLNWLTSYARGGVMRLGKLCSVIPLLAEIMRQHMKDWESAEA